MQIREDMPGFTEHRVLQEWWKIKLGRRAGNDQVLEARGGEGGKTRRQSRALSAEG